MQFWLSELPCPLCLLQRAFICALAAGPILNLRYGPRASHYALSILAALIGAAVSVRQILLHIMPGDPGYGSAILGYHYYTWAFLLFVAAIGLAALMLLFDRQFEDDEAPSAVHRQHDRGVAGDRARRRQCHSRRLRSAALRNVRTIQCATSCSSGADDDGFAVAICARRRDRHCRHAPADQAVEGRADRRACRHAARSRRLL